MQIRIEIVAEDAEDLEAVVKALQAISRAGRRRGVAAGSRGGGRGRAAPRTAARPEPAVAGIPGHGAAVASNIASEPIPTLPDFVRDNPWLAVIAGKRK